MAAHDSERGSSQYANECEGGAESNSNECLTLSQRVSEAEKITGIIPAIISYSLIDGKGMHAPLIFQLLVDTAAKRGTKQNELCTFLILFVTRFITCLIIKSTKCLTLPPSA